MRITTGIMVNNTLVNINKNKVLTDKLNTQLNTTKKIQRPSEDPIIASRALRFRSTYNEIEQYLKKNIPDARNWIETTQSALDSMSDVIDNIYEYCSQGVEGYQTLDERNTLVNALKQLRKQVFSDGDATYLDRCIFTGYKTDKTLTFKQTENDLEYTIKQSFTSEDIKSASRINGIDISQTDRVHSTSEVTNNRQNIIYLGYSKIHSIENNQVDIDGTAYSVTYVDSSDVNAYRTPSQNQIICVKDTGEMILGANAFTAISNGAELNVTYEKKGFDEGELRPEHYFDCVCTNNATNEITNYTQKDQTIEYTINFNQTIRVNTQAQKVLKHDFARDLDAIIYSLDAAINVEGKINSLQKEMDSETDPDKKLNMETMMEALKLEKSYTEANMSAAFAKGMSAYQGHKNTLSIEKSDLGARLQRLTLNETRLSEQKLDVEDLMSQNEEIEEEEVAVKYTEAQSVYDASLAVASKIIQRSLLDYL